MITVKGYVKFIRTAALMLKAVLLLGGCSGAADDLPYVSLGEENNKITEYRVIISREASGEVIDRARSLCTEIGEQTGVQTLLFYDDESLIYKDDTHELAVGYTSRTVSRVLLRGMRKDDYICAVEGGRTVLGGRSDEATLAAIDRFCREILPASSARSLLHEDGGFFFKGSYPVERVTLFGVELSEYSLEVTRSADTDAIDSAYLLRRLITERTGYILDVTVGSGAGRRITLRTSADGRDETAYSENTEMGVLLTAKDGRGLKYMGEYICELLCVGNGADTVLPERLSLSYDDASIRIGSACFSSLFPFGNAQGVSLAAQTLKNGSAEIALCGVMEQEDCNRLLANMTGIKEANGTEATVLLSHGQPSSVTAVKHWSENGLTVETFKIETPRLKLLLTYVCGSTEIETEIPVAAEEGYISVALVHTEGACVTVTGEDMLTQIATAGDISCYANSAELDVVTVGSSEMYGEFEFFAR